MEALRKMFGVPLSAARTALPAPAEGEAADCAAALEGSCAAWDRLICRHQRRVVVSLLARGVTLERAKELSQDAWARLLQMQRAGRLERLELPGLAVAQARFLALESARTRSVLTVPLALSPDAERVSDLAVSAEQQLITADQLSRARVLARGLPRNTQVVLEALYADPGASHREIAEEVGLSVQRVRQILCEVRAKVRQGLENER